MNDYTPKYSDEQKNSTDRIFGFVFAFIFLIIGLYPILDKNEIQIWSILISFIVFIVAIALPTALASANRLWMKFGIVLHKFISPLILSLIFFLVIMPTGLLMRILGKDLLNLRIDRSAKSYWIKRVPPGPEADSMNNQF